MTLATSPSARRVRFALPAFALVCALGASAALAAPAPECVIDGDDIRAGDEILSTVADQDVRLNTLLGLREEGACAPEPYACGVEGTTTITLDERPVWRGEGVLPILDKLLWLFDVGLCIETPSRR